MIYIIYSIILIYFLLGGVGFYFINRKKERMIARRSYIKFVIYFFIINILFFSIVINQIVFQYLSVFIIGVGMYELLRLYYQSNYNNKRFCFISLVIYGLLSTGFVLFGTLQKELILFAFIVLSIFDSFSQITGQLWGRKKMFPKTSPNKTIGGFIGGGLIAIGSAFLLKNFFAGSKLELLILTLGIVFFAFAGDLGASFYKRKYRVKDFSRLLPGHGGFLDRFDSLITAGAWVAFFSFILNF
ncbi:MAG TPA: phosphatidate cytidylyltransferase [Bacteroidales bacterium]|nr:phosphatidate cytidylyltransferase [Bacteroidales bacterium]